MSRYGKGTFPPSLPELTPDDIRAFRAAMDWSQVALARFIGVHRRTVEGWEKREDPFPAPAYLRYVFAAFLGDLAPWTADTKTPAEG